MSRRPETTPTPSLPTPQHHDDEHGSWYRWAAARRSTPALHPLRVARGGQGDRRRSSCATSSSAAPQSSINAPIGAHRRFTVVDADLDAVKAIKRALGGTVNDVVLAAVAGGLRALLDHRGDTPPAAGLRAMVPVNVRDPIGQARARQPDLVAVRAAAGGRGRPRPALRQRARRRRAA